MGLFLPNPSINKWKRQANSRFTYLFRIPARFESNAIWVKMGHLFHTKCGGGYEKWASKLLIGLQTMSHSVIEISFAIQILAWDFEIDYMHQAFKCNYLRFQNEISKFKIINLKKYPVRLKISKKNSKY